MKSTTTITSKRASTILIAEDSRLNQELLKNIVATLGHSPILVDNGASVLEYCKIQLPDLILLDMLMPRMNGREVLIQLRTNGFLDRVPVIVVSSIDNTENIAACIRMGAKDYMVKPFNQTLLQARIEACLERKHYHEREEQYYRLVEDFNEVLEKRVQEQVLDITQSHLATIFAMSKLAESRDSDTGAHLERMREYSRALCLELRPKKKFRYLITDKFIEDIFIASPLHDLGKVAIPDSILQKNGKLDPEEWRIMKQHTTIGADTLQEVFEKHPSNNFLRLGIEIAENHHEKWDGSGYPHGRVGEDIPLPGRILALADVYDALTSKRCYKEAFSHEKSRQIILDSKGSHFDLDVVDAFLQIEDQFVQIKDRYRDQEED
jgi:putative two-component system response regulator